MSASASAAALPAASAVSAQQTAMRELIAGNLYDTKIVGALEENVKFQMKTGSYDADSNRELLKLYAVSPDMIRQEILSRLLLKCMQELPSPDFFTSLYLIHERFHALEPIKLLTKWHALLETCQFKKFWSEINTFRANASNASVVNFAEAKDFDASIRKFVSLTVATTYSSISSAQLKEVWGLSDKKAFEDAVQQAGWQLSEEGKTVVIRAAPLAAQSKEMRAEPSVPSMEAVAKLITSRV